MAYLTLQKGSSANLNNVAVKDGQILVTTDTKQIYLDNGSTRLALNHFNIIDRSNLSTNINIDNPPVQGFFELRASNETPNLIGTRPTDAFIPFLSLKNDTSMLQIAGSSGAGFYLRGYQGSPATCEGIDWVQIYTTKNKPTYSDVGAPSTTGINASGTWGISITGNAGQLNQYATVGEYSKNTLAYFNANLANTGTAQMGVNDSPSTTATWWHFLRFTHANNNGYYTDLAIPFNVNSLYYKRIANGKVANDTTNAGWVKILDQLNYTDYTVTKTGSGASGTWGINIAGSSTNCTGNSATATTLSSTLAINKGGTGATTNHQAFHNLIFQGSVTNADTCMKRGLYNYGTSATNTPRSPGYGAIETVICNDTSEGVAIGGNTSSSWVWQWGYNTNLVNPFVRNSVNASAFSAWRKVWLEGDSITGAVWNDYAEYRESDCQEFGRVLVENGNDTLSVSTERLQPFAGVSSDTWGFCQGETEKAKTPIAVAGRVLVYPYRDRNKYKPGDVVCAAPNGTVDIMTPQEEMMYPSRIVGTVSCVPDYEEWGNGDREPAKVNGRIWIKVK